MNKKVLSILSAISLLCSCTELVPEDEAVTARKFSIYLTDPVTRTVNDGMSTKWVVGDRVSVLFAEAGTTNYQRGFDFAVVDAETGRIEGVLPEEFDPNLTYDWYISHGGNTPTTPAEKSVYVGIWGSEYFQIQTGNSSKSHLAGARYYPLVGNVKGVPGTKNPTVRMRNVASVIEFNLTNGTDQPIIVQDIQLKTPERINGKFSVDFSGEDIIVASNKSDYIAKLQVNEGTAIKPGESAKFYMGAKPFSFNAGDELKLVVTATKDGKAERSRLAKTIETPITFNQGEIKTLNYTFAPSSAPLEVTKADFDSFNQGYSSNYKNDLVSLDGWITNNCRAVVMRPSKHTAPTLSGKTSAPGVLTSPLFAHGCSILTFKYGVLESVLDSLSFKVEVFNEAGEVVWTKSITEAEPVFEKGYDFSETVNVPGVFRLRFTNLCPTDATWEKDCVSLYDMSWTNVQ